MVALGTYTTIARMRKVLLKLTGNAATGVMIDDDVDAWIVKAEAVINSKIGNKYTVPFTTVPPVIAVFAEDITAYMIMRTMYTQDSQNKTAWIEDFKAAISSLNAIRDGKQVVLDSSGNELSRASEEVHSNNMNYHPTFDVDDPLNQSQDDDKITEIEDARE